MPPTPVKVTHSGASGRVDNVAGDQRGPLLTDHLSIQHRHMTTLYARQSHRRQSQWIGAAATILPGVTIGADSVVAAGAVVTHDVPPATLVAGAPATVIRSI